MNFEAGVAVQRVTKDDVVRTFVAEIVVRCRDCGKPFRFRGVPVGLSYVRPASDISGEKLSAPIVPYDEASPNVGDLPGYSVEMVGGQ